MHMGHVVDRQTILSAPRGYVSVFCVVLNPGSSALEADALTTRLMRRSLRRGGRSYHLAINALADVATLLHRLKTTQNTDT